MDTNSIPQVAIIGAGPYGLSLAAHLRAAGIAFRIFGQPMQTWATQMPAGMKLKSDGFASNLSAPTPFTLEDFCRLTQRPYHPTDTPVPLEDFLAYGIEFQRRFVPTLDTRNVVSLTREAAIFTLNLADGDTVHASQVVVATGLSLFQHIPLELAHLPASLLTHTTEHTNFAHFANREVTVLGRGASALNAATLLQDAGADVTLITRHKKIHVHSAQSGAARPLLQRLLHPASLLGVSLRSRLACAAPGLFRALPFALRRLLTWKHLGPAGGSDLAARTGKIPTLTGWHITHSEVLAPTPGFQARLKLTLRNPQGQTRHHITSHIIAGTGFHCDLTRLTFLSPELLAAIRREPTGAPRLNPHFASTAPGLHFIGPAASTSFGPLLRFAAGAHYAATHLTTHFLQTHGTRVPQPFPTAHQPTPTH